MPNKLGGGEGGGQDKREGDGTEGQRFFLNLINGVGQINKGIGISKNPLISVMNGKRGINV